MNLRTIVSCCICVLLAFSFAMAQEKKPEGQPDMQAMMEMYTKLATPGAPHKQLEGAVGSWTTQSKSWMDPSQPPMESSGSCEQKMVLGGRFLQQECTGSLMGNPYTGIGVTGYDNHTKKYVSTWMDSMGTGLYFFEGTGSPDGKTVNMTGSYDDPIEGPMKYRTVTKFMDNNTHVFEMYGTGKSGKEAKLFEITYTRK